MNYYDYVIILWTVLFFLLIIYLYYREGVLINEFDENFDRSYFKIKKHDAHVEKYIVFQQYEKKSAYLRF